MSPNPTSNHLRARIAALEAELEKRSFELNQRIRELKSVLELTTAAEQVNRSREDFFRSALEIVVASFQYPDIACAELKIGEEYYSTANFQATSWKLGRGLMEGDSMVGYLTVCYLEEKPVADFGPFTKEEKNLLVLITRYLVQIHRRKRYEAELDKFRQVITHSQSMIMITNWDNKSQFINDKFKEVMGYTSEELDAMEGDILSKDEEGRADRSRILERLSLEGRFAGEVKVESKWGRVFWVRASATVISNDGQPQYFLGVFDDISDERDLKRKNRENQEMLNNVMENIPVSITLLNKDGYFIFYNNQARKNLRQSAKALGESPIQEIFPKEGMHTLHTIRNIFTTKQPITSDVSYTIEGRQYFYHIDRLPLFDENGEVHSVMSIAHDITEKKNEEKLQKIQHNIDSLQSIQQTIDESMNTLFDNLFELDWMDAGGLYLVNEEKRQIELAYHRGLSPEFIANTSVYSFDSPNAHIAFRKEPRYVTQEAYLSTNQQDILQENITFVAVLPLIYQERPVGLLNLASRRVTSIGQPDRQALEIIAIKVGNLIELIHTRERLTRANIELTKNLRELQEKQRLLVQKSKLESLGEIAAGLAHEINQPLSVISMAFENIMYKLMKGNIQGDYFAAKSETINLNIDKIRQLIDHIRIFSRDESSVMFEKLNVNLAIYNTLALLDVQLKSHRIRLTLDLEEEGCTTLGNLTKMEQVMMNLVSNARDAVDEKAKGLKGTEYIKQISIKTSLSPRHVWIILEDNGIGIRKGNVDKVFNPFFTTKPPGQGTGLGLSIVYEIIHEMKGKIQIESVYDKFTRVKIQLPRI